MQRQGVLPDVITYSSLISTSEKGKQPEQALEMCEAMQRQGVVANVVSHNSLINTFEKVGLNDCFPNDKDSCSRARPSDLELNEDIVHDPLYTYLYPETQMNSELYPPHQFFIPSKTVMFKLMRSCIGVKFAGDLWID